MNKAQTLNKTMRGAQSLSKTNALHPTLVVNN